MNHTKHIVRQYALRSVSDDYENVERIFADVTCWAGDRGIKLDREELLLALQELIREGYVQAYRFEPPFRQVIPTDYAIELIDDL